VKVLPGHGPIPSWDSLWASFELELLGEHGVSPNTLRTYRESARQFVEWLQTRGRPTEPALIQRDEVQGFLAALRDRGARPATIRVRFSSLRRFFGWCEDEEEIPGRSPMHRMQGPRVDEPPPEVLSDDEITALLRACDGEAFEDRRDMVLIRLMFDSGLRRIEAAGIAIEDLDLQERRVRIIGKGQREEVAYFGAKTARDLDRYPRVRPLHWIVRNEEDTRPRGRGEATEAVHPLWLAQKGFLSPDGIHHAITRRAELAGLRRQIWPHLLRHSFGDRIKAATGSDEVGDDPGPVAGRKGHEEVRGVGRAAARSGSPPTGVSRRSVLG
jgi:integrase/recombinase XerD